MNFPGASGAEADFSREHGWLVVEDAVALVELDEVARRMEIINPRKERLAFDWACKKGKSKEERGFKIVQGSPALGAGLRHVALRHDVDESNSCICFIDRGHRDGILEHFHPEHIQSDLFCCEPDLSRRVACPIRAGSVTFHHGKTPHMTPPNKSEAWRRAVTTHMRVEGSPGEGDHFS